MTATTETKIVHKSNCARVFSRYDNTCPRCLELINGAKPRDSWTAAKDRREAAFAKALKAHNCKKSGCMPICTFGDW